MYEGQLRQKKQEPLKRNKTVKKLESSYTNKT